MSGLDIVRPASVYALPPLKSTETLFKALKDWKNAPDYIHSVQNEVLMIKGMMKEVYREWQRMLSRSRNQKEFVHDVLAPTLEQIQKACDKWAERGDDNVSFIQLFEEQSSLQSVTILLIWRLILTLALTSHKWCSEKETFPDAWRVYQTLYEEIKQAAAKVDTDSVAPSDTHPARKSTASHLYTAFSLLRDLWENLVSSDQHLGNLQARAEARALAGKTGSNGGNILQDFNDPFSVNMSGIKRRRDGEPTVNKSRIIDTHDRSNEPPKVKLGGKDLRFERKGRVAEIRASEKSFSPLH